MKELSFRTDISVAGWFRQGGRENDMALVTWSENLSVGVKLFDEQHSVLFNYINDL